MNTIIGIMIILALGAATIFQGTKTYFAFKTKGESLRPKNKEEKED